ncbi:autotransporter outer membrane beta-barrel domain-containing protein [Helicobacter macacae]|uniref:Autotransporter domain-containing protein n=1 Tax=Helicobacter macacae MIT 99-5501 TaxID=1357400 RepID=V8CAC6_9HELI|nr:hypothetical protein [Helicobacter macacae]ETD24032.1 hypothetical protein HMPREF2086_00779 [Helicobacter macacae MIT 99-5501]
MKQGIRRVSIINSTITKRERERESSSRLDCHTEQGEVSKKQNRDISLALNMTTKNGWHNNANNPKSPRKLALSLITSVAFTGVALDILAAACSSTGQANYWTISCSGNMNASDLYNPPAISSGIVTINLNNLTTNGGSKLFAFQRYGGSWATNGTRVVNFNNVNSASTTFSIGFNVGNWNSVSVSASRIGTLTVSGNSTHTISVSNGSNIGNLQVNQSNSNTTINGSSVTSLSGNWIGILNVSNGSSVGTISNAGIGTLNANNSTINTIDNTSSLGTLNLNSNSRLGNLTNRANKTINTITLNSSSISGTLLNNGTINTLTLNTNSSINTISNNSSVGTLTLNGGSINTLTQNGTLTTLNLSNNARIENLTNQATKTISTLTLDNSSINGVLTNAGTIGTLSLSNSSRVGSINSSGNITSLTIRGDGSYVGSISGGGTIGTLSIGNRWVFQPNLGSNDIDAAVNTLLLYSASIEIDSEGGAGKGWNDLTKANPKEHIKFKSITTAGIGNYSIYVGIGQNAPTPKSDEDYYETKNLVVSGTTNATDLRFKHISPQPGVKLIPLDATNNSLEGANEYIQAEATKFRLEADVATSYGASMYRALALSYMRRNAMTQNILDTMTTKTFHSDKYYTHEVELRLLQYDMARLTNRSTKFSKLQRKNTSNLDKVRQKIAKVTLEQSKGQDLDKGYNNFELIDQLDAIFIPYSGRKDWRLFALPYGANSIVGLGASSALEWAGGAIFGIQRNLRKGGGIFGGYVGYEFVNTDTQLVGAPTRVQTNSLQAGLNYFKTFAFTSKVWEGFIKASIRGGVDLPRFTFQASGQDNTIQSNTKASSIPLLWSAGAEVHGGITFYQFKRNSYVAPEIGISYDILSTLDMKFLKPFGASEFYDRIYWHLPQVGLSLRYYKIFGNTFRLNTKIGIKYNILNNQEATFTIGQFSNKGTISLPAVYGNLSLDFIWMVRKNHELSLGYDGLFYANKFVKDKQSKEYNQQFNGVTTTLNLKYAYWFGGTDYVKDKEGNVISTKSTKKPKKSKPKKQKKSNKKVYYIDG